MSITERFLNFAHRAPVVSLMGITGAGMTYLGFAGYDIISRYRVFREKKRAAEAAEAAEALER